MVKIYIVKDMHIIQVLNIPSTQCVQDLFVSISCNLYGHKESIQNL